MLARVLGQRLVIAAGHRDLLGRLRAVGFAHVTDHLSEAGFLDLAATIGVTVGRETIALRPGAHAYVARPGPVPLHTDQPEVDFVAWWCEEQDETGGASRLLDARAVIEGLDEETRATLHHVHLLTPPLWGGPPTRVFPVLRASERGDLVFCSPWLRPVHSVPAHVSALDAFRRQLSNAATHVLESIRMRPGEALIVDNRRVLHGRGAIAEASRRRLKRIWIKENGETWSRIRGAFSTE